MWKPPIPFHILLEHRILEALNINQKTTVAGFDTQQKEERHVDHGLGYW